MSAATLSICIPTFNRAAILRGTLEHLVGLDTLQLEVVISDNASTDGTPAVIDSFRDRFPRFIAARHETNIGVMPNFAAAMHLATGDYVYTLSDDDRLIVDGIHAAISALEAGRDLTAAFGGYQEWDPASNRVLQTISHVEQPRVYAPADKLQLLSDHTMVWFPVARRDVLHRFCEYDGLSWGMIALAGQLLDHGPIVVLPDLFYQHAHTPQRQEHHLTEPWYHDMFRADYELYLAGAVDQPDMASAGQFIASRVAPAYFQAVRFAKQKHDYLTARHFVMRAKAYGLFTPQAVADWERDNFTCIVADRIRRVVSRAPGVTSIIFEGSTKVDRFMQALADIWPDAPRAVKVSREAFLNRPPDEHEFMLADEYETLATRMQRHGPDPSRQRAVQDLAAQCRLTKTHP